MERMASEFVRRRRELERRGEVGQGKRYPAEMAAMAREFAALAARAGWSQQAIADRLELPVGTLTRWIERGKPATGGLLREVVVCDQTEAQADGLGSGLSLVTPDGFRIEGLRPEMVGELVAALRR